MADQRVSGISSDLESATSVTVFTRVVPSASAQPRDFGPLTFAKNHASIQKVERLHDTNAAYFLNKGYFSEEEKVIIRNHCSETPAWVMERLKEHDPLTTSGYKHIKGTIDNERRKKNRREENGPWTQGRERYEHR